MATIRTVIYTSRSTTTDLAKAMEKMTDKVNTTKFSTSETTRIYLLIRLMLLIEVSHTVAMTH